MGYYPNKIESFKGIQFWTGIVDKFMKTIHDSGWSPKVFLDIGSCHLEQTIEVAQYHPDTRFIAFEPVPENYQLCYKRSLEWDNVEVYNFAISNVEGYSDFWVVDENLGGSSLLEPIDVPLSTNQWNKTRVYCKRLDNFLKFLGVESVDCIWMDTQGTELNVLKSLGKYIDDVLFVHTEASPNAYYKGHILQNDLEEFLRKNNFNVEFIPNSGHPYGEGDIIASKPELVRKLLNQA